MNQIIQWLIRNSAGEITGPLTTTEVIRKIRSGHLMGEEYISRYPSGRWFPIAYNETFFNILLEALEEELFEKESVSQDDKTEVSRRIEKIKKEFDDSKTQAAPEIGQAILEDLDAKTPIVIEVEKEKVEIGKAVVEKKKKRKKEKKSVKKPTQQNNKRLLYFVGALLTILIVYILLNSSRVQSGKRLHLTSPSGHSTKKLSRKNIQVLMGRGIKDFRKDNLRSYIKAQDTFVEIIEKTKNLDAYAFLCMTYRELWPFSFQDARDHNTLQVVLRGVQKVNPKSPSANVCLVVSHWVKGQYEDALRIMDNHLAQSPGLLFFNQMAGDIYAARKDYRSASYYFSKVRELWSPPPVWSKTLLQEARMYRKQGIHGNAVKLYRRLLKENPHHAVARIELGLLEFYPYQNIKKSQDFIQSGLTADQFIPKPIEAEALVTLAKMSILQGDNKLALKQAKKAFSTDSSNEESKELIVSMGGLKELNTVSIDNVNMVYLGEQYMKMNNFTAAQAEFRAAFAANPENGFAALRAGEALWELNQSNEAIEWIKKSIQADPSFVRGYLILADFQSARFDYVNAIETLKSALRVNRRHHGIYRGFALVELRRRNYQGAIRFAKKALELYDTDIDSLLIVSQALYAMQQPDEAFQYVQQALELDSSNEDVHIIFAKILASLQGTQAGINYLDSMISKFGKTVFMRGLGELYAVEERHDEAIQAYYAVLQKDPKNKKTLMALAKILQKRKNYEQARDYLLEAAILDPSDAEPLFLIGQLYLDSGKYDFALKQFQRVISVNSNYPLAYYFAGRSLLALNQLDRALELSDKERLINPEIPEPYLLAAETYYKKRQYRLCTGEYQKVLQKGLNLADVYIKLARCYRLSGAFDSAATMLSEAERRESGNPDVYKELGALYHKKGDYIKALEAYKRYLQLRPHAKDKKLIQKLMLEIQNRE